MKEHPAIQQLNDLIQSRSILQHPFYQAWRAGKLSHEQLATYAEVYYPHVAAFPGYLQQALRHDSDPSLRAELERNLAEELGVPKAHNELWLDFAVGLGVDRQEVINAARSTAEPKTVRVFNEQASLSIESALAALYAYESQQPEVARQKADGLRSLYGISEPKTLAYFEVHAQADIEHRAGEVRALERCLEISDDPGAVQQTILEAAGEALDAYWLLLDDVCNLTGMEA